MAYDLFPTAADLGEYIFRITDNGGETTDRYTIVFSDGDYFAASTAPDHPQGVGMSGEGIDVAVLDDWIGEGRAVDLGWYDLPERVRRVTLAMLNDAFRDYVEAVTLMDPRRVGTCRDAVEVHEGLHSSTGQGLYHDGSGYRVKRDETDDDLGPYADAAEAIRATLPSHYSLTGPEYHSTALDGVPAEGQPDPEIAAAVAALERVHDAAYAARIAARYPAGLGE